MLACAGPFAVGDAAQRDDLLARTFWDRQKSWSERIGRDRIQRRQIVDRIHHHGDIPRDRQVVERVRMHDDGLRQMRLGRRAIDTADDGQVVAGSSGDSHQFRSDLDLVRLRDTVVDRMSRGDGPVLGADHVEGVSHHSGHGHDFVIDLNAVRDRGERRERTHVGQRDGVGVDRNGSRQLVGWRNRINQSIVDRDQRRNVRQIGCEYSGRSQ